MENIIILEEAVNIIRSRVRINRVNIMDAVFIKNGKEVKVSKKRREHWRFTGLNTIDFVDFNFK